MGYVPRRLCMGPRHDSYILPVLKPPKVFWGKSPMDAIASPEVQGATLKE